MGGRQRKTLTQTNKGKLGVSALNWDVNCTFSSLSVWKLGNFSVALMSEDHMITMRYWH
jgi:hypothetical protein